MTGDADAPVLAVDDLHVRYRTGEDEGTLAVAGVSLRLRRGECYGLVGESGCGKSTVAFALMRRLGPAGAIEAGRIRFAGDDLTALDRRAMRRYWGRRLAMVYQEASSALNPTLTVGAQLEEVLRTHFAFDAAERRRRIAAILEAVGLEAPLSLMRRYPHQLSGGQQQRVVVAMAYLGEPELLVLDEPTTALDVTIEAEIIDLLVRLRASRGTSMLVISHNLGVVGRLCDRIGVMYAGQIVEEAAADRVLAAPAHPYTRGLIACIPRLDAGRDAYRLSSIPGHVPRLRRTPDACTFLARCAFAVPGVCDAAAPDLLAAAPGAALVRCHRRAEQLAAPPQGDAPAPASEAPSEPCLEVTGVTKTYVQVSESGARRAFVANRSVDLALARGRTLAIVGESGSGKSTLARIVVGLDVPDSGRVVVNGEDVTGRSVERRGREIVRHTQMIFQSPETTLNPSHRVDFILGRAVRRLQPDTRREDVAAEIRRLLDLVRLPRETAGMWPGDLSGGQKQRVAIARAFAGSPALVVADEPTSALDASVKTAILELLLSVQRQVGTSLLFISHDLASVRYVADDVAVMHQGEIVEKGPAETLFAAPQHPYTQRLLAASAHLLP